MEDRKGQKVATKIEYRTGTMYRLIEDTMESLIPYREHPGRWHLERGLDERVSKIRDDSPYVKLYNWFVQYLWAYNVRVSLYAIRCTDSNKVQPVIELSDAEDLTAEEWDEILEEWPHGFTNRDSVSIIIEDKYQFNDLCDSKPEWLMMAINKKLRFEETNL